MPSDESVHRTNKLPKPTMALAIVGSDMELGVLSIAL